MKEIGDQFPEILEWESRKRRKVKDFFFLNQSKSTVMEVKNIALVIILLECSLGIQL